MSDLFLERPFDARMEARGLTLSRGGAALVEHLDFAMGKGALVGAAGFGEALPALVEFVRGPLDPWPGRRIGPPLYASAGALVLCGADAQHLTPATRAKLGVGVMLGSSGPPLGPTCLDHLAYAVACAWRWRVGRASREDQARILLDRVGLGEAAHHAPTSLDPVSAAALHLATALAAGSKLAILAWPFRDLDGDARAAFAPTIARVSGHDAAILLVDADIANMAPICSRLLIFWRTRLLADGAPEWTLARPAVAQALGAPPRAGAP